MTGELTFTAADREALRKLADGGSIPEARFGRLCDLGLCGYEARTTIKGTQATRREKIWIKAAGRRALDTTNTGGGDA